MKRFFIITLIVMIMCPIIASAGSFIDSLYAEYDGLISYAEIGDKLIIIGDYDRMVNAGNGDPESVISQYSEELKKYTAIVLLLEKDGTVYLGAVIPLTDGIPAEGTAFPLMSPLYMQENTTEGQDTEAVLRSFAGTGNYTADSTPESISATSKKSDDLPTRDSLKVNMELSSSKFTEPETITVSITVSNVGKSDFPGTVSLYYPNGKQVEDFGSPVLTAGSSIKWSGSRTVTQEELDEGKIIFMFRYSAYDDEGKLQSYAVGITKHIQYSRPES